MNILFDPKKHTYTAVINGKKVELTPVSTILDTIKDRSHSKYYDAEVLKKKIWSEVGTQAGASEIMEALEWLLKDDFAFTTELERHANVGTALHKSLELEESTTDFRTRIEGEKIATEEEVENLVMAYNKFKTEYELKNKVKYFAKELIVGDEKLKIAGTLDALIEVNGKIAICDYKTTNKPSIKHLVQLSAYWALLHNARLKGKEEKNTPKKEYLPIPTHAMILYYSKLNGSLNELIIPTNKLRPYLQIWNNALYFYKQNEEFKKLGLKL